jgi:hypothetical protein
MLRDPERGSAVTVWLNGLAVAAQRGQYIPAQRSAILGRSQTIPARIYQFSPFRLSRSR